MGDKSLLFISVSYCFLYLRRIFKEKNGTIVVREILKNVIFQLDRVNPTANCFHRTMLIASVFCQYFVKLY